MHGCLSVFLKLVVMLVPFAWIVFFGVALPGKAPE
jgi:hypothetical protein